MGVETPFRRELETLINRCSMENGSNTPDFILADFLVGCLAAFDHAVKERTVWHDPKIRAGAACGICKGTGSATDGNSFYPCPNCSSQETPAARPCVWRTGCRHEAVCDKHDVCVPGGESPDETLDRSKPETRTDTGGVCGLKGCTKRLPPGKFVCDDHFADSAANRRAE